MILYITKGTQFSDLMSKESSIHRMDVLYKELKAIIISVFFLLVGIYCIIFFRGYLEIEGDVIFVSLLLMPIITYFILSGRLSELKAPGGLEAKFRDFSKESVELEQTVIEFVEAQIVSKGVSLMSELRRKTENLDESKPIILSLTLGEQNYTRDAIIDHITYLSKFRTFKFVVLLDQNKKFGAYMLSHALLWTLKDVDLGDSFVNTIKYGDIDKIQQYSIVITKPITIKTTNMEALRNMTNQNLDSLVVVDEGKNLKGIVEREQILSKLMISLAE